MKGWVLGVMMLALAGCGPFEGLVTKLKARPVKNLLIVVDNQVDGARNFFHGLDLDAIRECRAVAAEAGIVDESCRLERCDEAACTVWRGRIDPRVKGLYNTALVAANVPGGDRKAMVMAIGVANEARREFLNLARDDVKRKDFWAGLATAIQIAIKEAVNR